MSDYYASKDGVWGGKGAERLGLTVEVRALIAAMLCSFARVSAVLQLEVDDYYHKGARRRLRLGLESLFSRTCYHAAR
jgi:hypothetical protein